MGLIKAVALKPYIKKTVILSLLLITYSQGISRPGNTLTSEIPNKSPVTRNLFLKNLCGRKKNCCWRKALKSEALNRLNISHCKISTFN